MKFNFKRIISVILSLAITVEFVPNFSIIAENQPVLNKSQLKPPAIFGDVSGDGVLNVFDLSLLKRYVAKEKYIEKGDVDGDGDLDIDDIKCLQGYLLVRTKSFPVYKKYDSDDDKLSDYVEAQMTGTSSSKADTDNDGLSDCFEITYLKTDPNVPDSIANEDPDSDGLSNAEESKYFTNPFSNDTDKDGLSDYDEINLYKTNPNDEDSDDDTLSDKEEVVDLKDNNLDPNNPNTGGTPDGEKIFEQEIPADSPILSQINTEDNAYNLSLTLHAAGNANRSLHVEESGYSCDMKDGSSVGAVPELIYDENYQVKDITLKFEIKEEYRESALELFTDNYSTDSDEELDGIKRFNVFKYFEEIDTVMPIDTKYDIENNTVYVTISSNDFEVNDDGTSCGIGSYSLVDLEVWGLLMNESGETEETQETEETEETQETVETDNTISPLMSDSNVGSSESKVSGAAKSILSKPIEIIKKILKNYYGLVRVNTPTSSTSNVITYRGHKYSVINGSNLSWSDAEIECEKLGGHLMTPSSEGEFELLCNVLTRGSTFNHYWIGASYNNGKWQWVNKEGTVTYLDTVVKNIEGDNYNLNDFRRYIGSTFYYADGMSYYHNGDLSCSAGGYICEWDSSKDYSKGVIKAAQNNKMTFVRTLNGFMMLNGLLSKNSGIDTDNDGLSDYDELNFKLINKVLGSNTNKTDVSWIQVYSWLSKNGKSKGLISGTGTNSKINKAVKKTSTSKTSSSVIETANPFFNGDPVISDKDGDYYPDGSDPKPKKFTPTEVDMGIIDDSQMDKPIVLHQENTSVIISENQRLLNDSVPAGGKTQVIKMPENYEKASLNYDRDYNHKVEFLLDNKSPKCVIFEVTFDSTSTAQEIMKNDDFLKLNDKFLLFSIERNVSRQINFKTIKYTLLMEENDKYIVEIDSKQCKSPFSVSTYCDNLVYAANGAIAFKDAIEKDGIIYSSYSEIYFDAAHFKEMSSYDTWVNDFKDKPSPEKEQGPIRHTICEIMYLYDDTDYMQRAKRISEISGNISTFATYAGIPLIVIPGGEIGTILGGIVTMVGAGSTGINIAAGSSRGDFESSLRQTLENGNLNVCLTSFETAQSKAGINIGWDFESNPEYLEYFDPVGSSKWNNWKPGYISRIRDKSVLNVATGLQKMEFNELDKIINTAS